jgi:hypothetical protein
MQKLSKSNRDKKEMTVRKSSVTGKWMIHNYFLDDTYFTDLEGEVRDCIADNTILSTDRIRLLVEHLSNGTLTSITFSIVTEDDYEGAF